MTQPVGGEVAPCRPPIATTSRALGRRRRPLKLIRESEHGVAPQRVRRAGGDVGLLDGAAGRAATVENVIDAQPHLRLSAGEELESRGSIPQHIIVIEGSAHAAGEIMNRRSGEDKMSAEKEQVEIGTKRVSVIIVPG